MRLKDGMRRVCIILPFVVGGVPGVVPSPYARGEPFANTTCRIGDEVSSREVKLVDGQYRDGLLCVYYDGDAVYGDFNKDELTDAAVVISDSGCGSGYSLNLAFLINDGKKLVHESSYDLGYKSQVTFLAEWQGEAVVDTLVQEDVGALPIHVRKIYAYAGPTRWGPQRSDSEGD